MGNAIDHRENSAEQDISRRSVLLFKERWAEHVESYKLSRGIESVPKAMLSHLITELRYSIALELGDERLTHDQRTRAVLYDEYRRAHSIPHASDALMLTGNPYV